MDWLRFRKLYLLFSSFLIILGVISLIKWGLKLGIDFKGGTIVEYKIDKEFDSEEAVRYLRENGFDVSSIQSTGNKQFLLKITASDIDREKLLTEIKKATSDESVEELRFESVGPSVGSELIKKTIIASSFSSLSILLWIALQFKSFRYGISAVLAMLHDTFNLIGIFSILGHFLGAEVDFLFVTAFLTTLSFSVHDTIVVYDRIRESQKNFSSYEFYNLANKAVSETMVRSLNNSFTIIFMLVAMVLLGGTSIKWFATALLIGTILGTYSSPFIAVPLLIYFDELARKRKQML